MPQKIAYIPMNNKYIIIFIRNVNLIRYPSGVLELLKRKKKAPPAPGSHRDKTAIV